jgi:hypothetical protein
MLSHKWKNIITIISRTWRRIGLYPTSMNASQLANRLRLTTKSIWRRSSQQEFERWNTLFRKGVVDEWRCSSGLLITSSRRRNDISYNIRNRSFVNLLDFSPEEIKFPLQFYDIGLRNNQAHGSEPRDQFRASCRVDCSCFLLSSLRQFFARKLVPDKLGYQQSDPARCG